MSHDVIVRASGVEFVFAVWKIGVGMLPTAQSICLLRVKRPPVPDPVESVRSLSLWNVLRESHVGVAPQLLHGGSWLAGHWIREFFLTLDGFRLVGDLMALSVIEILGRKKDARLVTA